MGRSRFAQVAVVVLGLAGLACWKVSARPGDGQMTADLFQQVIIAPGDDPSLVPLAVGDAGLIEIDRTGALLVHNGDRVRRQQKPRAYQDIKGRRLDVSIRFDITPAGNPRLVVGPYDRTRPLVIN